MLLNDPNRSNLDSPAAPQYTRRTIANLSNFVLIIHPPNLLFATLLVHQVQRVIRVSQLLCGRHSPCQSLGLRGGLSYVVDHLREPAGRVPAN